MAERAAPRKSGPEEDGIGAGEGWEAGRGDGGRVYLRGVRRVAIGDFSFGGKVPSDVAHERARLAAQAPLMYEALIDLVSSSREAGFYQEEEGYNPSHRVGCECGACQGLLAVALVEGGGRCVLCGCTEFDACAGAFGEGCSWVDTTEFVCTAHSAKRTRAARKLLRKLGAMPGSGA